MAQRETYLTSEGLAKLREELDHLIMVRRQEIAQRIQRANEIGGTVDNAEYDEAKNEQAFIEGRIRTLENLLQSAVLISSRDAPKESVGLGSSVTVINPTGHKERYIIVGSVEVDPLKGKISNESPVGRALLGRKVGDEIEVRTPSGVMKLTITEIR